MSEVQELASAYRAMMDSYAWKHLKAFIDAEKTAAYEMAINSDELKDIQLQRGIVKSLNMIESHIGYILEAK